MHSQAPEVVELKTSYATPENAWIQSVIGLLGVASRKLGNNREAAHLAIEEATTLLQAHIGPRTTRRTHVAGGLRAWQARMVCEYVETHIADRVLVSVLSACVRLSEAHFARAFRRTFGVAPHAFVLGRRLERAARLMLESGDSLADIAVRCGFTDQAHLCRQFRRLMGDSPARWRLSRDL